MDWSVVLQIAKGAAAGLDRDDLFESLGQAYGEEPDAGIEVEREARLSESLSRALTSKRSIRNRFTWKNEFRLTWNPAYSIGAVTPMDCKAREAPSEARGPKH